MQRSLLAILLFLGLVLFVISPFAALANLMIVLLVAAFIWTISTIVQIFITGESSKNSAAKPDNKA